MSLPARLFGGGVLLVEAISDTQQSVEGTSAR